MSFRDYIILAYDPSYPGNIYPDAASAFNSKRVTLDRGFKTEFTDLKVAESITLGLVGANPRIKRANAFSISPPFGAAAAGSTISLSLNSAKSNIQFYVRPYIRKEPTALNHGTNNDVYKEYVNLSYDMSKALNSDILYTNPPSYQGRKSGMAVYAPYSSNSTITLGPGNDVIIGGIGRQTFNGQDAAGKDLHTGNKVIVGGSNVDIIQSGSGNDYLVGDVHAQEDNGYNARNIQLGFRPSPNIIASTLTDPYKGPFASHNKLIHDTRYDGMINNPVGRYDWNDFGVRERVRLDSGVGGTMKHANVWQPLGDLIHGGDGDDIIFGDDDYWNGNELIVYKNTIDETIKVQDAIDGYGSITTRSQWQFPEKKLSTDGNFEWNQLWNGDRAALRLGDDILFGGAGNDVIYGGFGSDLIVGGEGIDVIHAPTLILTPGFDPLWRGASVLYGDRFTNSASDSWIKYGNASRDVLTNAEIDERRFGRDSSGNYSNWRQALTQSPDHFIFTAPIFTENELQAYSQNYDEITRDLAGGDNDLEAQQLKAEKDLAISKAVNISLDLAGYIPIVGDFIQILGNTLMTLLESPPSPPPPAPTLPSDSSATRVVKDFDIYDSLTIFYDGNGTNSIRDGVSNEVVMGDVASKWFKARGYEEVTSKDFDFVIDQTAGVGNKTKVVLSGFSFTNATRHFIKCIEASDLDKEVILTKNWNAWGRPTEIFREGSKLKLSKALQEISDGWVNEPHYFATGLGGSNTGGNTFYSEETFRHRFFEARSLDDLKSAGFYL